MGHAGVRVVELQKRDERDGRRREERRVGVELGDMRQADLFQKGHVKCELGL